MERPGLRRREETFCVCQILRHRGCCLSSLHRERLYASGDAECGGRPLNTESKGTHNYFAVRLHKGLNDKRQTTYWLQRRKPFLSQKGRAIATTPVFLVPLDEPFFFLLLFEALNCEVARFEL